MIYVISLDPTFERNFDIIFFPILNYQTPEMNLIHLFASTVISLCFTTFILLLFLLFKPNCRPCAAKAWKLVS